MCMTKGLQKEFYNVEDQKETTLDSCGAFYFVYFFNAAGSTEVAAYRLAIKRQDSAHSSASRACSARTILAREETTSTQNATSESICATRTRCTVLTSSSLALLGPALLPLGPGRRVERGLDLALERGRVALEAARDGPERRGIRDLRGMASAARGVRATRRGAARRDASV